MGSFVMILMVPAHCISTKQGRPSSADNLYTLYHIHRNLLQAIHTGQSTDYRTAIDKNLRIRPFQPIDTHLREAAVLAVVLHTQPRLVIQGFSQIGRIHRFEKPGIHHIDYHRSHLATCFIAIGRYDYLVRHNTFVTHQKMNIYREVVTDGHFLFLCLIAQ